MSLIRFQPGPDLYPPREFTMFTGSPSQLWRGYTHPILHLARCLWCLVLSPVSHCYLTIGLTLSRASLDLISQQAGQSTSWPGGEGERRKILTPTSKHFHDLHFDLQNNFTAFKTLTNYKHFYITLCYFSNHN